MPGSLYSKYIKTIFDKALAIIALIMLSPIIVLVSIYCIINFNGRIIFRQKRIGKNKNPFTIYKFITLLPENPNNYLTDTERSTKAGQFLRRYSLDEIPQIINILIGEMSWIGPRPLLAKYLPYYQNEETLRHSVKPGITGLAQINGRNQLNWDDRLAFDIAYVKTLSFKHDIIIFLKTLKLVLTKSNPIVDPRLLMQDLDEERKHLTPQIQFTLRKPTVADVPQLLEVKNNTEAAATLEKDNSGYNEQGIKNWINSHNTNPGNDLYVIIDNATKTIIGHAGLYNIQSATADFGILIGLPNYWNRGIGTLITKQIIEIGFRQHKLSTINLNVLAEHTAAIAVYKKIGFKETSIITGETIKNGKPTDILIMQINKL